MQMFDKQIQLRMGQANVARWVDDILPLLTGDDDPLGTESFATHHVPLAEAPEAYEMFQTKEDGTFKVVFEALRSRSASTTSSRPRRRRTAARPRRRGRPLRGGDSRRG